MPRVINARVLLNTEALLDGGVRAAVKTKRHTVIIPDEIYIQYERDVKTGRLAGNVPQLEVAMTQLESSLLRKKNWTKEPLASLNPLPRFHKEFYQYAVGERARFFVTDPRSWRGRHWNEFVAEFRTNHRVSVVTRPEYIADP